MKDLMKRLLCVLMALVMIMALCACGESEEDTGRGKRGSKNETTEETTTEPTEPENPLAGEWEAYVDFTDYFNDMMEAEAGLEDVVEDFSIRVTLEFTEDGEFTLVLDQEHMEKVMADLMDSVWDLMMEISAEEYGMTKDEVIAAMEEAGVTKDALLAEMDLESMFEDYEDLEGYYLLDGDELLMAEDEDDVEDADPIEIDFDGDDSFSMIGGDGLEDFLGDEEVAEAVLPLVFERI